MAKFKVTFTIERDDELKEHDETFFDRQHIADEIQSWLQDLDFTFPDGIQIQVEKQDTQRTLTGALILYAFFR